jgi:YD repeat-containing protein
VWSATPAQGYDATGNRTGSGNTPIAGNRMSTAAGETLSYDANGAVIGRSGGSGGSWAYAYDQRGQVTSATLTVSGTVQQRVTYAYDAFGNRLSRANGATDN